MMIKINRARKLAAIGSCPSSFSAMVERLPAETVRALTGRQLAQLIDHAWQMCCEAKTIAARESLDEGCLWDARRNRLMELRA